MKDAWPTFWEHNQPLFEKMVEAGFHFVERNGLAYFTDASGQYVAFPKGYITGPHFSNNGSPRPWSASVYNGESWYQWSTKTRQEVIDLAIGKANHLKGVPNVEKSETPGTHAGIR